jgi:hypothetical protein
MNVEVTPALLVAEFGDQLDTLRAQREHHANPRVRANADAFSRMSAAEGTEPNQLVGHSPDGEIDLISFVFDRLAARHDISASYQQLGAYRLLINYR